MILFYLNILIYTKYTIFQSFFFPFLIVSFYCDSIFIYFFDYLHYNLIHQRNDAKPTKSQGNHI